MPTEPPRGFHHVELWVPDLSRARGEWGWLLGELGWEPFQSWAAGVSWRIGSAYLVVEQSRDLTVRTHDRRAAGLNHLALHAGTRADLDRLHAAAPEHGWIPLFGDRYPHAGGPDSYAAYLLNNDGFEVELVTDA